MESAAHCTSLMPMAAAVSVLVTTCLSGHVLSARLLKPDAGFLERLSASVLIGCVINSCILTPLALAGLFLPSTVLSATALCCIVLILFNRRDAFNRLRKPELWEWSVLICVVASCVWGLCIGSEDVASNRDPGVYACTAVELAKTGDLGWTDPLAKVMPMEYAKPFYEDINMAMLERPRWMFFPGYYLRNTDRGVIEPQFLHVFEPWLAIGYWLIGSVGITASVVLWTALFMLLFAVFTSRLFGTAPAIGATLIFAVNPAVLWYMRTPSNEAMAMCFLWGAMLFFLYGNRKNTCLYISLFLLLIAMCSKFAIWLSLPAFGFILGCRSRKDSPSILLRHPAVAVTLVQLLALAFALTFSYWYTWGSAYVSFLRHGIQTWQVLALFLLAPSLSVWVGKCCQHLFAGEWSLSRRSLCVILCVCSASLVTIYLRQSHELSAFLAQTTIHADARWMTAMSLPQLSFYFGTIPFCIALIALPFMFAILRKSSALLLLVILASSVLLLRSGIDAVHPWCVRRWLIVLIPALCLSIAIFPFCLVRLFNWRFPRVACYTYYLLMGLCVAVSLPTVSRTRQFNGFRASGDRLAEVLRDADFVVAQPSSRVAALSGYLWSEHGIDMRPLQKRTDKWAHALEAFRLLTRAGKKICYVSDVDSFHDEFFNFIHLVKKDIPFRWTVLGDGLMRPKSEAATIEGKYFVWEINGDEIPFGWQYPEKWNIPFVPTLPFRIDDAPTTALQSLMRGWTPCDLPSKTGIWVNHTMQLHLGSFAKRDSETSGGLELTMNVSTGRESDLQLNCGFYTDLARKNQRSLCQVQAQRVPVPVTIRIPYKDIRPDCILSVSSEGTEVERSIPLGQMQGILLDDFCIKEY